MAQKKETKKKIKVQNVKVRDLKPKKDAKGGSGGGVPPIGPHAPGG
jgi:hypothetical protein